MGSTLGLSRFPWSFQWLGISEGNATSRLRVTTLSCAWFPEAQLLNPVVPCTLLARKLPCYLEISNLSPHHPQGNEGTHERHGGSRHVRGKRRARTKGHATVTDAQDCLSHGLKVDSFYPVPMTCSEGLSKTSKAFLVGALEKKLIWGKC